MIINRAKAGEYLRVVDDQYMAPTYSPDLVKAVAQLVDANATGTVHITNEGCCTWYEFAKATLELAGIDHPIEAVSTDSFPSDTKRPGYSVLESERTATFGLSPLRHWRDALLEYLQEKKILNSANFN